MTKISTDSRTRSSLSHGHLMYKTLSNSAVYTQATNTIAIFAILNVVRERRTLAAQSGLSREVSKIYITPERGFSLGLSFRAMALYIQTRDDLY